MRQADIVSAQRIAVLPARIQKELARGVGSATERKGRRTGSDQIVGSGQDPVRRNQDRAAIEAPTVHERAYRSVLGTSGQRQVAAVRLVIANRASPTGERDRSPEEQQSEQQQDWRLA